MGRMQASWTYEGQVQDGASHHRRQPGHHNPDQRCAANEKFHSIDLHAAQVSVIKDFEAIKPGETKTFTFVANYPGAFCSRSAPTRCTSTSRARDVRCNRRRSKDRRRLRSGICSHSVGGLQ